MTNQKNEIMAVTENAAAVVVKNAAPAKTKKAAAKKPQRVTIDDFIAACDRAAVTVHNRATNHSMIYRIVGGDGGTSCHVKKTKFILYIAERDILEFEAAGVFGIKRGANAASDKSRPHYGECENTTANLNLIVQILAKNSFNKSH